MEKIFAQSYQKKRKNKKVLTNFCLYSIMIAEREVIRMRVVTINEDNHGMIGIAKTYADAVHLLVNDCWLSAFTEIYCGDGVYKTVIEDLGENWLAVMLDWSMVKFCEYFAGLFYLDSVEVYEVA